MLGTKTTKVAEHDYYLDQLFDYTFTSDFWLEIKGMGMVHLTMHYQPETKSKVRAATVSKMIEKLSPPAKKDRGGIFCQVFTN